MASEISVVIPLGGDGARAPDLATMLGGERPLETVVAAGPDVGAEALDTWRQHGARVLPGGPRSRGARLRLASDQTRGSTLLFLHADTRLPPGGLSLVTGAVRQGATWGAFRLGFADPDRRLSVVAAVANARSRMTRIPYGDQALFCTRQGYQRAGGHPDWPLLDDVELARRLKRLTAPWLLAAPVRTSGAKYLTRGVARQVLANWSILLRYAAGASPESLAARYWGR